jgi:hypothetical protein
LADKIKSANDVELETIHIKILVDCYGVYLNLYKLLGYIKSKYELNEKLFNLAATTELASVLFTNLEYQLKSEAARIAPILSDSFEKPDSQGAISELNLKWLCKLVIEEKVTKDLLRAVRKVTRIELDYEWFFAPFPKDNLEKIIGWKLKDAWSKKDTQSIKRLQNLLDDAGNSRVSIYGEERDYSIYDDFIREIADQKRRREANARLHHGTYKYFVSGTGVNYFNEKQVDTLICIRAMECLYDHEADSVCIVSTDTDFLPLFHRFWKAQVPLYQSYGVPKAGGQIPEEHKELEKEGKFIPSFISWEIWQSVLNKIFKDVAPEISIAIQDEVTEMYNVEQQAQ